VGLARAIYPRALGVLAVVALTFNQRRSMGPPIDMLISTASGGRLTIELGCIKVLTCRRATMRARSNQPSNSRDSD
jgi:hypothetical protein